jgi:hypothetical protein
MLNIKRRFKVLSLRFRRWIYLGLNTEADKEYLSIQKKAEIIISKAIDNEESLIYKYNEMIYITYNNFVIKFDDKNALITNGKFTYYVSLSSVVTSKLFKQYQNRIFKKVLEIDNNNGLVMSKNLSEMIRNI